MKELMLLILFLMFFSLKNTSMLRSRDLDFDLVLYFLNQPIHIRVLWLLTKIHENC